MGVITQEHMWEAGQLRDASAHRLEAANVLDHIEAAAEELDRRMTLWQVHMEHGCSTWKGGDVTEWWMDAYYTVMANVIK